MVEIVVVVAFVHLEVSRDLGHSLAQRIAFAPRHYDRAPPSELHDRAPPFELYVYVY